MRRRDFGLLACAAAMAPQSLFAQATGSQPRAGWLLFPAKDAPLSVRYVGEFWDGMRELGYTEGQSIEMLYRYGDFHADRIVWVLAFEISVALIIGFVVLRSQSASLVGRIDELE
jgi:hypothetical protein